MDKLNVDALKVPTGNVSIWKDECAYSFATPESAGGLYLNLTTYQSFSEKYVHLDHEKSGNVVYLHQQWIKHEKAKTAEQDTAMEIDAPSKLAIGVPGGFLVDENELDKYDIEKVYSVVVYPKLTEKIVYPSNSVTFPPKLVLIIDKVLTLNDASKEVDIQNWSAENENLIISKYAHGLVQLDNGIKISHDPSTWQCADSGLKENLWLNLSDGYIGSGRPNAYGTGGTGAALKHYEATGKKYPLCVKLGTITPDGKADVYSYASDEDDMVIDPHLSDHLKHWGLNMKLLSKTDKSLAEMEVDLNASYDWSRISEDGVELESIKGGGYVGLSNIGNSCYVNSILQVLFSLPEMQSKYLKDNSSARLDTFKTMTISEPQSDITIQLIKLCEALFHPDTTPNARHDDGDYVEPRMLKNAVGKGHPDYKGTEQQDAAYYMDHLLQKIQQDDHRLGKSDSISELFSVAMYTRKECLQSHQVKYGTHVDTSLALHIPMHKATNALAAAEEKESKRAKTEASEAEPVRPVVPFEACLEASIGDAAVDLVADYLSPVTGQRGELKKQLYFATFPKYLVVRLNKYVRDDSGMEKKLDVQVPVPLEIDLTCFRSTGIKESEVEMAEEMAEEPAAPQPRQDIVDALMGMGFSENGSMRAALATNNAGAEQATEWVFAHMEDADFNAPIAAAAAAASSGADAEQVSLLQASTGFSQEYAEFALAECSNDVARAADFLFSHMDDIQQLIESKKNSSSTKAPPSSAEKLFESNDGEGRYRLKAIVSHLGKNTGCGHYVCHVLKDGKWIFFNDRKVKVSQKPPLDMGYAYIFERL